MAPKVDLNDVRVLLREYVRKNGVAGSFLAHYDQNGQLISLTPEGVAPIAVGSTTRVINLNADLLDGRHYEDLEAEILDQVNEIVGGASGLVIPSHGELVGLGDDDHLQYLTEDRAATLFIAGSGVTMSHTAGAITVHTLPSNNLSILAGSGVVVSQIGDNVTVNATGQTSSDEYDRLIGNLSTGIISGGLLTIDVDDTKFKIAAGTGTIVDNHSDPTNPIAYTMSWPDTVVAADMSGPSGRHVVYITMDKDYVVHQSLTPPTVDQFPDVLYFGVAAVLTTTGKVVATYDFQSPAYEPMTRMHQFFEALGSFNIEGNQYTPNGVNLRINRSEGKIFRPGSNYSTNRKVPDTLTTTAATQETFFQPKHVSGEWAYDSPPAADLDPNYYDNLTDLTAVPAGYWTIRPIYFYPSARFIPYGQATYATSDAAKEALGTQVETHPILTPADFVLRGHIIVKQGATDLSDPDQAQFIEAGKFSLAASAFGEAPADLMANNMKSTGLIRGGILSINSGDPTLFDITAGEGIVVKNYTDPPGEPILVSWPDTTGISDPYIATIDTTYVNIDEGGNIVFGTDVPDFQERRDIIAIGWLDHPGRAEIEIAKTEPFYTADVQAQVNDFFEAFGPFNISGNTYAPLSGMTIQRSAGSTFDSNANYENSLKSPHVLDTNSEAPAPFYYYYRTGSGWINDNPLTAAIDPDHYDNNTLPLATVPTSGWTNQLLLYYPISEINDIQYGQTVYNSKAEAIAGVKDAVEINPYNSYDTFRGWLTIQQGTTDITDENKAVFTAAGKLGIVDIASGGGSGGEVNTGSNVNLAGIGVFHGKIGVDLQFRGVRAASEIVTVVENASYETIDIDVDQTKISHTNLLNIGSNSHDQIDAFISVVPGYIDAVSNALSNEVSARESLSATVSSVEVHAAAASAAATSADSHAATASAAAASVDSRVNTVSQQVSVLSQAVSVLSQALSVVSSLAATADSHASTASAAATSVDSRVNTLSGQVSVISQQVSVLSQAHSVLSNALSNETSNRVSADNVLSNAISGVLSAHNALSNYMSNVISSVGAGLSNETSARANADSVIAGTVSVLTLSVNVVSNAASAAEAHAATASAAATSVDSRVNAISQQVSVLSQAVSVLSQSLSVVSSLAAGAETHASAASAAATSADAHAAAASAAATSVDSRVNTVSNQVSVLSQQISVLSQAHSVLSNALSNETSGRTSADNALSNAISGVLSAHNALSNTVSNLTSVHNTLSNTVSGLTSAHNVLSNAVSVVSNTLSNLASAHEALSNRVSANSGTGGGGSVTSTELSAVSAQAASAINVVSNALSALMSIHDVLSNRVSANSGTGGSGSVTSQELSATSAQAASAIDVVSNALSALLSAHEVLSNRVSANSGTGGGGSVTSTMFSSLTSAHDALSNIVSNEVSVRVAADDLLSQAISVLSNSLSVVSSLAVTADDHASTASAAATSVDSRVNTLSNTVSNLASAHSSLSTTVSGLNSAHGVISTAVSNLTSAHNVLSNTVSSLNSAHNALSDLFSASNVSNLVSQADALSQQISVISAAASVLSQAISVMSVAVAATSPQVRRITTGIAGMSTVALTNISGLSISCAAGASYYVDGCVLIAMSVANAVKLGFTFPATTAGGGQLISRVTAIAAGGDSFSTTRLQQGWWNQGSSGSIVFSATIGTAAVIHPVLFRGTFVSTAAGTIQVQLGASVTTSPCNVQIGSFIRAYKLA